MARPRVSREEIAAVVGVLRSGNLAAGETVSRFERAFAGAVGSGFAVAVSSGTAALVLALRALPLRPGDVVITTPFSFVATGAAIVEAGATPLFVDVDPHTCNLSPAAVEAALRRHPDVRAVVAVHLYGLPVARELIALCAEHSLYLVEDAAQAHGAEVDGRPAGSLGRLAAFSFYATKNVTTGEGGMVTTSDPELAARVRLLANHGQTRRYHHEVLGLNHRMTEFQAAIGLGQLASLPARNQRRRRIAAYYDAHLPAGVAGPVEPPGYRHAYHLYTLRTARRDEVLHGLAERGIDATVHYPELIHRQPCFRSVRHLAEPCPVAERLVREVVSIPCYPELSRSEVEWVAAALGEACAGAAPGSAAGGGAP